MLHIQNFDVKCVHNSIPTQVSKSAEQVETLPLVKIEFRGQSYGSVWCQMHPDVKRKLLGVTKVTVCWVCNK